MDDFLYNLRRESDKRNRRQTGQQQYRGPDRRNMKDQQRRGTYARRNDAMDQLAELLPEIKSLLESIGENQKRLLTDEKRKMLALENIAASLRMMSGNTQAIESSGVDADPTENAVAETREAQAPEEPPQMDTKAPADEPSSKTNDTESTDAPPKRSNREDIRKIALELRAQGKTYKEIAQHLDDEHIPTFSGKGGWHAPTIHKLCK